MTPPATAIRARWSVAARDPVDRLRSRLLSAKQWDERRDEELKASSWRR